MAILSFPSITPDSSTFGMVYNTQISLTSLSGIAQTVGTLNFGQMTLAESAALKAFLLELRGSAGRFFYSDISKTNPFASVTGSPTIESVSTNRIIRVTLGSSSPALAQGDYVQLGSDDQRELKYILSSTNISGDTYDLTIEPAIRRTDFIGLSVVYNGPKGVFFLSADDQAMWSVRSKALLSDINLDFTEMFIS